MINSDKIFRCLIIILTVISWFFTGFFLGYKDCETRIKKEEILKGYAEYYVEKDEIKWRWKEK